MGLDTSHNAWHGPYSSFNQWRHRIAEVSIKYPLDLMEGYYEAQPNEHHDHLPIKWSSLTPSPIHDLLFHSDCDGDIQWQKCKAIADELENLLPKISESDKPGMDFYKQKTEQFIKGLRLAHSKKENLEFH